jgi:hypothetical protein
VFITQYKSANPELSSPVEATIEEIVSRKVTELLFLTLNGFCCSCTDSGKVSRIPLKSGPCVAAAVVQTEQQGSNATPTTAMLFVQEG